MGNLKSSYQTFKSSCLALCLASTASASFAADDKAAFDNAVALYQKGNYAGAIPEFTKLETSKDKGELSQYYKGLCFQQSGQSTAAKNQYTYLYYQAKNKEVKYKAWLGLKGLTAKPTSGTTTQTLSQSSGSQTQAVARKHPAADAWVTPTEGYGRSGPEASASTSITIIPTSCSRRR